MKQQINDLLKPELLNTVNGLELVARIVVEGFMSGSNRSQSIGVGYEFSQYRSYEPGDDLRLLDWKMYARSERYYIKQSEVETNITVKFILDASRSMDYKENGLSKLQYSKVMIAALGYLARKQSDTFGLYVVNDQKISMVEPRFEQQQFMRFLNELLAAKGEGHWGKGKDLEALQRHVGKEIIVFFTDLYDNGKDIQQFVSRLKTSRNEVIVFHVMGNDELNLETEGVFTFEDLETGERRKVDTVSQQRAYTKRVNEWLQQSRSWMLEKQIDYHLVRMSQTVESVLVHFLNSRKRLFR
ncbi:MAG TPA: DUF58 domain-containing protein [Cyclobacteriaceae bacterium]|nr:DUF58 domain-containing protein [Cyclobacteriaceae bacterium]